MGRDIDEIKPRKWLVIILILIALTISVVLINKIVNDRKTNEDKKGNTSILDKINIDNIGNTINEYEFNSKFERYTGSQSGFFLEDMFDILITHNKKYQDNKVVLKYNDINTNDPEEIKTIKKGIKRADKFEVSVNYNDEGLVYEIVLELTEKDMSEVRSFNSSYEIQTGTKIGISVKNLLDDVITNNKTKPERILTVIYKDINTTDVEVIKNLKSRFSDWTDYEISLNYNEEGFVYQIVIE